MKMKNKRLRNCVKLPNAMIEDTRLTYTARAVALAAYASANPLGYCHLGLTQLAHRAGCAITTAAAAIKLLTSLGYLSAYRNYAWSHTHGRMIYKRYTYVCNIPSKDFTFIPRTLSAAVIQQNIKKSTLSVYLCLRHAAGNTTRAYPSLNAIAATLGMAKATVCRAISELSRSGLVCLEHCLKVNHAFACNSYFFPQPTTPAAEVKAIPTPSALTHTSKFAAIACLTAPHGVSNSTYLPYLYYSRNPDTLQYFFDTGGSIKFDKL